MKILLFITDLQIGGTPTVVRELALRLRGSDEVAVASLAPSGPVAEQLRSAGVSVTALGATGSHDMPRAVRKLVSLIHRERFDCVLSFLIHANTVAAIASIFCPGVRFLQSIQTTQPTPRWHWWLQSLVHVFAERIVVPSPSTAVAARDWAMIPAEKIVVIPNAVEPPGNQTPRIPLLDGIFRVGFIGRLDPIKRVPDLIAAMALLPANYRLDVYGEGESRRRIEREIGRLRLQDRVMLHGSVAEPWTALRSMDVLVLPSAAEGFGLVLIEAMAAGVPVIATDVPGIRDVVQHQLTGWLVPVASPRKLAEAIALICSNPRLRKALIERAAVAVRERYSWDAVLPMYRSSLATR